MIKNIILGMLIMSIFSCGQDGNQLLGRWKVVGIKDAGQSLDFDMDSIYFEFREGDSFLMTDTYGKKIMGAFKMEPPYLYISTFEREGESKKPLEILKFTPDTLELLMNRNGVKRTIYLQKK